VAPAQSAQRKSDRTRARILAAATDVFSREGLGEARLSGIADAAGLQTASLYYYFDSKDALIEAIVGDDVDAIYAHVRERVEACGQDDHAGRLAAAIDAHLERALTPGSAATVRLYGQLPAAVQHGLAPRYRAIGDYWTTLLVDAQRAGAIRADLDPHITARLLLGALNWATEWHRPDREATADVAAHARALIGL
jgi:AcrR family transcriptional regulator